jgi:hypothetical protein
MSAPARTTTHTHGQPKTQLVRPIGTFERLFYRYSERNPVHFSIVAEFDVTLTEAQIRTALSAVQQRHPLLSVHVEDHPGSRLGFYRADSVVPIDLTVRERCEQWQLFAAAELARPFDRSTAPLMRAVLLNGWSGSTVVLTFDHTIADGISSVTVMNDLVNALNGEAIPQRDVPPSVEDMIARTIAGTEVQNPVEPSDPRLAEPTSIRRFDGTHPYVHTVTLDAALTAQLVSQCRTEHTTVHAAILTAASRVHSGLFDKEFVRVMSPINLRPLINTVGDCADHLTCTITGMTPRDGATFWNQARTITAELSIARSAPAVAALSATIQQAITVDAECATTEQFFTTVVPFDLMISNLGCQDLRVDGSIKPTGLWGPLVQTQVDDYVIGVVTYDGRLRMISSGYTPSEIFLESVKAILARAAQRVLV